MKNRMFTVLAIAVIVMVLAVPVGATSAPDLAIAPSPESAVGSNGVSGGTVTGTEEVYIVLLEGASLARYRGGVPGLEATSPSATGAVKLDAKSPASIAYLDYLANQQAFFIATMEQTLGHPVDVLFRYDVVLNGLAVRLTAGEAAVVAGLPGVRQVEREVMRQPATDVGPAWIGAEGIWDGSATGTSSMGEGIIVGMIDTGINGDHPSFADPGPSDGYDHVNPLGAYLGDCAPPSPTYTCNDKLIGVYDFTTAGDPEDFDGHGSHTSSTAAGNVLTDITIDFPTISIQASISGVAPHANIISYRACGPGGCPDSATNAAINQAVADGVDVINYSIGGGPANPWLDTNALAYLDAREAGVFVATSAGNDGPGAGTVGSPANAPWLLSLGNATHNRTFTNTISFTGGDSALGPFTGTSATSGYGPEAIVHAGDYGDPLCGSPFDPGTWSGEIVVCDRGEYALVDKVANAANGGAGAVVIANAEANGLQTYAIPHELPSIHLNYADSEALRTWLTSGSGHQATITDAVISIDDAYGDRLSVGSSRGPNAPVPDVIKPDVIAPGSDILAAYKTPEEYNMISGTSMASPHAAGAAILLRSLHPDWTVAQIQSAIVSTAIDDVAFKEDWITPADPFDMGGGRVYASYAAQTGLVLDETVANFEAANPGIDGDPATLNLATIAEDACDETCSWTRVVSSTLDTTESWTADATATPGMTITVTPASFDLAPHGTQAIVVEVDMGDLPVGEWFFGRVTLTPDSPAIPEVHLPVAVTAAAAVPEILVEPDSLENTQVAGMIETLPLTISNNGELPLEWSIYEYGGPAGKAPLEDWFEDFDSYPTGQDMHGVGGWKGWDNDPAATAYTTDAQARSTPNSVDIVANADLVHEYAGADYGIWTYTAWQYIPGDFDGESYFLLLNTYSDDGAKNWSTQVNFNSEAGLVVAEGEAAGETLPIIYDQWVEIRVEIDLISDVQQFYYGGDLLYQSSWTDGVSGGGDLNIGAVDLYANAATSVYYDDLSLVQFTGVCSDLSEIPWLSASPDSGTTEGGASSPVDVGLDATGLSADVYTATLCVSSNDLANSLIPVPVTMTVTCTALTGAEISGPAALEIGEEGTYTVAWEPPTATLPIDIVWSNGVTNSITSTYSWDEAGDYTVVVTVTNCGGEPVVAPPLDVEVVQTMSYVYLPIVVKDH